VTKPREPQVSARVGAMIFHAAALRGADVTALSNLTGFSPDKATDPDALIPLSLEESLWEHAASMTGDDSFGLHAAETMKPGQFDVLDYAIRTAQNVREALAHLVRYNRLVHDLAVFDVNDTPDGARIEHRFANSGKCPCRHASEFTLASLVVIGAQITGRTVVPARVGFAHPAPSSTVEHERLFGILPQFRMPVAGITLSTAILDSPVLGADSALSRIVTNHADNLLGQRHPASESTASQVIERLTKNLSNGLLTLSDIARGLNLSERSLQRRLADEGATYAVLVDTVRKKLALQYVADRRLALGEIAFLLGFAEPSPFHRAFRHWTGTTPASMRQSFH
jgi:AraC-like DNA-binding protein